MKFVAIDVETANPDLSSICQVGIAMFENGSLSSMWQRLVDPEDYFDPWNVSIHGITERDVRGAPTIRDIAQDLHEILDDQLVVCHTSFDRVAISRATEKYDVLPIGCTWLDSAKIVRRAWPQYARSGYGLSSIAEELGITFKHHEAQEDARAAGEIVLRATAETGINVNEWLQRVKQPIEKIAREGNPEGALSGEVVVFTGALSMVRREAATLAADCGCSVNEGVNKFTTLLVVGDQDIRVLAGHEKSSKHRKAEALIKKGQRIRIVGESDFKRIVGIDALV